MNINHSVLTAVSAANANIVIVTKYWEAEETQQIIDQLKTETCVLGWGENRTANLEVKNLNRDQTHFIGRLQSRQLPVIAKHCGTVHSVASVKHARKLNDLMAQAGETLKIFIQVNVAADPAKEGITAADVPSFLAEIADCACLEVVGLSSMGWGDFEIKAKRQEFADLITLRDQYLPQGKTSAGTSRDYALALTAGIDIVRVGKGLLI